MGEMERYLRATPTIDCDNELIIETAGKQTRRQEKVADKAVSLFYFVRDTIKYNPYVITDVIERYRASRVLKEREGYCITKAILLVALARAAGIPARLHFAKIQNYLMSDKLLEVLGGITEITAHGYSELYIDGRWVKATPAFDLKTCRGNQIIPVEFDGKNDAIFHSHDMDGRFHIEYIYDHGHFDDLPFDLVIELMTQGYGIDFSERMKRIVESR